MPVLPPRAMVPSGPKLLLLTMSRSVVPQQLGFVWMSVAHVATGASANPVLSHVLRGTRALLSWPYASLAQSDPSNHRRADPEPLWP